MELFRGEGFGGQNERVPRIYGPQPPPGDAGGDDPITSIRRRQARSSGVGTSDEVELSETSKTRVVFLPWYVPHKTQPGGLAGKVIEKALLMQDKWSGNYWAPAVEIYLDERAVGRLRRALEAHAVVAREAGEETVLLVRAGGVSPAARADAGAVAGAVLELLRRPDVLSRLGEEDLGTEIIRGLQGSLRVQELRAAVSELRQHLEGGDCEESVYQAWCTRHSWAFGNAHTAPDDLRRLNRTDSVDILLPRVLTGHRDIVELKRPDHKVVGFAKSWYWSGEVSMAIGQCREYMDNLHEDAARGGLRGRQDVIAYHPRATIVIGRSIGWEDERYRGLEGLNRVLNGITVMTYDQLLAQGEELLRVLSEEQEQQPAEPEGKDIDPDDIPF